LASKAAAVMIQMWEIRRRVGQLHHCLKCSVLCNRVITHFGLAVTLLVASMHILDDILCALATENATFLTQNLSTHFLAPNSQILWNMSWPQL
jgi:predicted Co/Zn/Cd cation transporter (cation efflux family)